MKRFKRKWQFLSGLRERNTNKGFLFKVTCQPEGHIAFNRAATIGGPRCLGTWRHQKTMKLRTSSSKQGARGDAASSDERHKVEGYRGVPGKFKSRRRMAEGELERSEKDTDS